MFTVVALSRLSLRCILSCRPLDPSSQGKRTTGVQVRRRKPRPPCGKGFLPGRFVVQSLRVAHRSVKRAGDCSNPESSPSRGRGQESENNVDTDLRAAAAGGLPGGIPAEALATEEGVGSQAPTGVSRERLAGGERGPRRVDKVPGASRIRRSTRIGRHPPRRSRCRVTAAPRSAPYPPRECSSEFHWAFTQADSSAPSRAGASTNINRARWLARSSPTPHPSRNTSPTQGTPRLLVADRRQASRRLISESHLERRPRPSCRYPSPRGCNSARAEYLGSYERVDPAPLAATP